MTTTSPKLYDKSELYLITLKGGGWVVYRIGLNGSQIVRAGPLYLVNYNDISTAAVE